MTAVTRLIDEELVHIELRIAELRAEKSALVRLYARLEAGGEVVEREEARAVEVEVAPKPPAEPKQRKARSISFTAEEDAILRQHYPTGGSLVCAKLLPGRSQRSALMRANRLGIRCEVRLCGRKKRDPVEVPAGLPAPKSNGTAKPPRTFAEQLAMIERGEAHIVEVSPLRTAGNQRIDRSVML